MQYHILKGSLHPTPPFDFKKSLSFIVKSVGLRSKMKVSENGLLCATTVDGETLAVKLFANGEVEKPVLNYCIFSYQKISELQRLHVLDRISHFLSLYDQLKSFYEIGQTDKRFSPLLTKLYGYHPVKFLTPFENACWVAMLQYLMPSAAKKVKQNIIERFGNRIDLQNISLNAFPEPNTIASFSTELLFESINDKSVAETILALAAAFSQIDEYFLHHGEFRALLNWLLKIDGLSSWSANQILLNGLGRTNRAPLNDEQLFHSAEKLYGDLVYNGVSSIAEKYGDFQGYWAQYLNFAA